MPTAFCEEEDVRKALQEQELKGSTASEMVQPAIHGASDWFARQTNGYWYDSGGGTTLVDTSTASATEVVLDIPSSPHAQERYLIDHRRNIRYPVTQAGPYAEVVLPHIYVSSLNKLEVRAVDGDVTDWVAESDFTEGVGNDYYLQSYGQNSYGRTVLRIDAGQIAARSNFERILTVDYDYGLDYATTAWDDVKRGIAALAAAEIVSDDRVIAQIPSNGNLIGVETHHQQLVNKANDYLGDYLSAMGDNR